MGRQMAVSPSRRQFVSPAVGKWQSLPVEDSLLPQRLANGSLFQQKTVCSPSSNRVDKWQSLPVEDSLFPQQSANGSLFQQKTVCSLSRHRVDKWQSLPVEDSLLPKQLANGSLFPRKDSLSVKHSKRSTNGSFFKQFVCFWDV